MSDLQEVGSEICKIAELFNFQQGIIDQTLADLITDYNGIILTIPVRIHHYIVHAIILIYDIGIS